MGGGALAEALAGAAPLLTDGGIETRIMFETGYAMDPHLQVAAMVADPAGGPLIRGIYEDYVRVAERAGVAVVIGTPTFRASRSFAAAAGRREPGTVAALNAEAAAMSRSIAAGASVPVLVAGVLGPARDAYTPEQALDREQARAYHSEQARALAGAEVDFLFAATFPAIEEAIGAGAAMGASGLPYVVSLVLGPEGRVLDGTALIEAVAAIDAALDPRPAMLSLSCIHPSVASRALEDVAASGRVLEVKANGSPLPTAELVQLDHPEADPPERFAAEMWDLRERFGVRVLGGCCGTDPRHMAALAERIAAVAA